MKGREGVEAMPEGEGEAPPVLEQAEVSPQGCPLAGGQCFLV